MTNFDYKVAFHIENPLVDTFNFSAGGSDFFTFNDHSISNFYSSFSGWLIIDSLDIPTNFVKDVLRLAFIMQPTQLSERLKMELSV